ncbi:Peptidyl-tRNA hydrolase, chloroplastic [Linum perenne]
MKPSIVSTLRLPSYNTFHNLLPFQLLLPSSSSSFVPKPSMLRYPNCCSSAPYSSPASNAALPSHEPLVIKPKQYPWLIVGLGNPGKKYQGTRHNVGFEMVDAIAEAEGISVTSVSNKALFGRGFIGNIPVMLAKPQTFMNASGESVAPIVSYYKVPLKQVLLVYDDLDLPFAKLRLLPKGGHGGHNGYPLSIPFMDYNYVVDATIQGIGKPPGKMDAANFVLLPFNRQERGMVRLVCQGNGLCSDFKLASS